MAEELIDEGADETLDGAAALLEELLARPEDDDDAAPDSARAAQSYSDKTVNVEDARVATSDDGDVERNARNEHSPHEAPQPYPESEEYAQRLEGLGQHAPLLARAMLEEFSDLKSDSDLVRLGAENPERYNRFQILRDQITKAVSEHSAAAKENALRRQESEAMALGEALPELRDPAKAPKLIGELREFARKAGYTQEQLAKASAKDWALLSKAMRFETGNAGAAQRLENARRHAAPPSGVQRPGVAREHIREESLRSDFQRLRKTGYVRDAASVIRHIMN